MRISLRIHLLLNSSSPVPFPAASSLIELLGHLNA